MLTWTVSETPMTVRSWLVSSSVKSAVPVSQRAWVRISYKPEFLYDCFLRNCFSCVHNCDDLLSIYILIPQFKCMISHIYSFNPENIACSKSNQNQMLCLQWMCILATPSQFSGTPLKYSKTNDPN